MSIEDLKRENAELKASNLELQNQAKLMETIFENLSEGVVAVNLKGEFLVANSSAREIVQVDPVDEDPEKWSETYGTFYPDTVTMVPSSELPLYKAMQGEITNEVELFIRNPHKPEGIFISVNGRPILDEANNLIGGVITLRDIDKLQTVRNQLEAAVKDLQTQNSLMNAVFNSISDGVIVANEAGKYVFFNETARKMVGRDIEDVHIPQASEKFGLLHPESEELYPAEELPLARALRGEHVNNFEILMRNPQLPHGISVSVSGRPIYDERGIVNGAVAAIRDVSEIKKAERQAKFMNDQLRDQSHLLESIFYGISDAVVVADETGTIIMVNSNAERIVGPASSLKNRNQWLEHCFYPDKVTPFPVEEQPLLQAIQGESTDNVEIFIRSDKIPDGIYASVSGRPLQDSDGNWKGGIAVFHDMTDRVKTQEALAQAFAQGRLEIVDTILHNIGNAINSVSVGIDTVHHQIANDKLTPRLTALADVIERHQDGLSTYITHDPQGQKIAPFILSLSEDFNAVKEELRQTVQRVRDRTRYIVDIIRMQKSYQTTSVTRKDINLKVAISDALKMLQDSIDRRRIQIEIDCDTAPQEIRIEESQFHQMLVNLIKNAVEAIDDFAKLGNVTEAPRIQLRVYTDGDFLSIDVTDNGIGIDPEDIQRMFAAGFTTKEYGSGLGLHSSANFVISIGGQIQPLSEGKGKGTTMHITFPYSAIQPN